MLTILGYNQGVFSGVLTMPAFKTRELPYKPTQRTSFANY